jgi:outer membrane protein OmpA-like peptidoglycan-associated protein
MKFRLGFAAALLCTASTGAMAQFHLGGERIATPAISPASFYVGIFGGAIFPLNSDIDGVIVPAGTVADWKTGYIAGATLGYIIGNGFRVELEGAYRRAGADRLLGQPATGRISNITAMSNVLYDIPTGTIVTPYIGAGIGVSYAQVRDRRTAAGLTGAQSVNFSDHDVAFAYQGIAGVQVQLARDWIAGIDYRFFGTLNPRINGRVTTAGGGLAAGAQADHSFINRQHTVTANIRYLFGQAAPPPPPPPPPAPAAQPEPAQVRPSQQAFLVFFDYNRSNLRPDAMETIQQAAGVIMAGGSARMTLVTGHTDTSGSNRFNQRLSEQRATIVRRALVSLGVPDQVITTRGAGESQLLVQTGDNTREQQNRRAEIVVQ